MSWIAVSTRHFQMSFLEFFGGVLEVKRNDEEKTQERLATTYTHTHLPVTLQSLCIDTDGKTIW